MRGKLENLIGKKFGRLTVVGYIEKRGWECVCECGEKKIVKGGQLNAGYIKSCGCLRKETAKQLKNVVHGFSKTKDKLKKRFYNTWELLRRKCNTLNSRRCIAYDPRWDDFLEFKKDMYFKYLYAIKHDKMYIPRLKRVDLNKGYIKENCIFVPNYCEELKGKRFGKLTVIKYNNDGRWLCKCDCGGEINVRTGHLTQIRVKSCGCITLLKNHGFANPDTPKEKKKFYKMWHGFKARCDNPNNNSYHNYGGRGITYDNRWKDFLEFKNDMYFKYLYAIKHLKMKNPSLERINVNGNYCKENCCFIELDDQTKNTRNIIEFVAISPEGKHFISKNVNEFSGEHNLHASSVYKCIHEVYTQHRGWKFMKR